MPLLSHTQIDAPQFKLLQVEGDFFVQRGCPRKKRMRATRYPNGALLEAKIGTSSKK